MFKKILLVLSLLFTFSCEDNIVEEPLGGAHRDMDQMAAMLKQSLKTNLAELEPLDKEQLIEKRYDKLMSFGYC